MTEKISSVKEPNTQVFLVFRCKALNFLQLSMALHLKVQMIEAKKTSFV